MRCTRRMSVGIRPFPFKEHHIHFDWSTDYFPTRVSLGRFVASLLNSLELIENCGKSHVFARIHLAVVRLGADFHSSISNIHWTMRGTAEYSQAGT